MKLAIFQPVSVADKGYPIVVGPKIWSITLGRNGVMNAGIDTSFSSTKK